jgi:hypothetical protein
MKQQGDSAALGSVPVQQPSDTSQDDDG